VETISAASRAAPSWHHASTAVNFRISSSATLCRVLVEATRYKKRKMLRRYAKSKAPPTVANLASFVASLTQLRSWAKVSTQRPGSALAPPTPAARAR